MLQYSIAMSSAKPIPEYSEGGVIANRGILISSLSECSGRPSLRPGEDGAIGEVKADISIKDKSDAIVFVFQCNASLAYDGKCYVIRHFVKFFSE